MDFTCVHNDKALIVDYKTGKPHNKHRQLATFALHTFAYYPEVNEVKTCYYWTQTKTMTPRVYTRADIASMWADLTPDLKQYAQAFKEDIWHPRQSGLCNGWCPVKDCEFWRPKRKR